MSDAPGAKTPRVGGFLGTLKDALAAAGRDDLPVGHRDAGEPSAPQPPRQAETSDDAQPPLPLPAASGTEGSAPGDGHEPAVAAQQDAPLSAAEAARRARGVTSLKLQDKQMEFDGTNTTRMVRMPKTPEQKAPEAPTNDSEVPARTQLVRGRQQVKRGQFITDPVVGWLVIVGGPGLGSFRPVFEGNNTIGRSPSNRISFDFGDEAISAEEQAYLRYDSNDRSFLLVPNMSKTNIVSLNNTRPTTAVELKAMDVITMGRTQLVFTPFCGQEFDWSEISEIKE